MTSRVLAFVLCWACASQAAASRKAYALVIGNNAPPASNDEALPPLRYADDDAVRY